MSRRGPLLDSCVLLFGDSITAGQYVSPSLRWTELIRGTNTHLQPQNLSFDVRAVSGETSRQALLRLPGILQEGIHDSLVIQLGLNDANKWASEGGDYPRVSEAAFEANLLEAIDRARSSGIERIAVSTNHTVLKIMANGENLQSSKLRYDEIIRSVARSASVSCFDFAAELGRMNQRMVGNLLLPPPDGVHLSEEGHKWYAGIFREMIRDFYS